VAPPPDGATPTTDGPPHSGGPPAGGGLPPGDWQRTVVGLPLVALALGAMGGVVRFVTGRGPDEGSLQALLDYRAAAVAGDDEVAFLADIDRTDLAFVVRQATEYANLTRLPLAELSYRLERGRSGTRNVPESLLRKDRTRVRVVAVTVRYRDGALPGGRCPHRSGGGPVAT